MHFTSHNELQLFALLAALGVFLAVAAIRHMFERLTSIVKETFYLVPQRKTNIDKKVGIKIKVIL